MRWFRRKRRGAPTEDPASVQQAPTPAPTKEPTASAAPEQPGPYDISEMPDDGRERLDLGVLQLPTYANLAVRIDVDRTTRQAVSVTLTLANQAAQLQVFAAPKSRGIWKELLAERRELFQAQNAEVIDQHGPLGSELVVKLPVATAAGSGMRALRTVGIEGPRWLLQVTFYGDAAVNPRAATGLEDLVRHVVVNRGAQPFPPKRVIPLTIPTEQSDDEQPHLRAPERGPEIQETR
ncbi:MAG: DUF3710 domain-containing protein [Bowdeniella nasicola]|nr:DUF3710 domain-containing protein [Bowdeniella nasicola]